MYKANYGNNMRRKGNSDTYKYWCEALGLRLRRSPPLCDLGEARDSTWSSVQRSTGRDRWLALLGFREVSASNLGSDRDYLDRFSVGASFLQKYAGIVHKIMARPLLFQLIIH
jgi:hypothetical protein